MSDQSKDTGSQSDRTQSLASEKLLTDYNNFLKDMQRNFPRVDQRLLIDIFYFQDTYKDWEGSVLLKLVYPKNKVDINSKKEWIYSKYQRVPSIEEERTLRFKAIRMSAQELERLLLEDPEIEYITGSATLTPSDAYSG
ncbi:MAG TPA: hypothetical protein VE089_09565 [Nitrososphaeraceae archaeon]|jgi:hypothetical protein|nr:hypothetical protein [Nitrososphaeraceae archaeon]